MRRVAFFGLDRVAPLVELYENLARQLAELYRSELETEMRSRSREKFHVSPLNSYEGHPIEDFFFSVRYRDEDVGCIFPFRRLAFCRRPNINPDNDPVFSVMQLTLNKRGYDVRHELKSPETLIDEIRKETAASE